MPLRLLVDRGGEKFVSFAKKKLADMKAWMLNAGVMTFTKHYFVTSGERIRVRSFLLPGAPAFDTIRIVVRGLWDFIILAPSSVRLFGVLGGRVEGTVPAEVSNNTLLRTEGKSWGTGLFNTETFAVLHPDRQLKSYHTQGAAPEDPPPLDGFERQNFAVNDSGAMGVFSGLGVTYKLTTQQNLNSIVVSQPDVPAVLHPLLVGGIYGRRTFDFGGSGRVTEFFDVPTGITLPGGLAHTELDPAPRGTLHDVLFTQFGRSGNDVVSLSAWSARNGLLGTFTHTAPNFASNIQAGTRENAYVMFYTKRSPVTSELFVDVVKAVGSFDAEGDLFYAASRTSSVFSDGQDLLEGGVVSTRENSYLWFFSGLGGDLDRLYIVDQDGSISFVSAFPPGSAVSFSAATREHAWQFIYAASEVQNTLQIFNETGFVRSFNAPSSGASFPLAGVTRDAVYAYQQALSLPPTKVLGSDGTNIDIKAALPEWVNEIHQIAFMTSPTKFFILVRAEGDDPNDAPDVGVVQVLFHITNAGEVKRYAAPTNFTSIVVPVPTDFLRLQRLG